MITRSRFSPAQCRRRNRLSLKKKTSRQSLKFASVCCSELTAVCIKALPLEKNWDHLNKIPAGEFYRISLDDTKPYFRIAGGLQDNENWVGPSAVQSKEGIRNCDWTALAGGDGFYVLFDPTDHDTFYAESQQGEVHRINLQNGEIRRLRPEPAEGAAALSIQLEFADDHEPA